MSETKAGIVSDAVDLVKAWTRERKPFKPLRPGEMPDHAVVSYGLMVRLVELVERLDRESASEPAGTGVSSYRDLAELFSRLSPEDQAKALLEIPLPETP